MAFTMNKPVIKGTKEHSALLKTAAEKTRTHSGDPTLGAAATTYGESFRNMDVIDYSIKSRELDWSKKKENKNKKDSTETKTTTTNTTTNTIINRKIETSNKEANEAKNVLINNNKTDEVINNPDSVIGYPHDYSNIDEMPTPKKETWRDRRRKRQEEKDLAKLDEFQANYETGEIENEKIEDEQLDIDAFVPEEEQEDADNFPKVTLAENDPRYKVRERTPRYNVEGKLIGYNYPPKESKMRPGYYYVDGQWRYNNIVVHPAEVPIEHRNLQQLDRNQQIEVDKVEEKKVEEGTSQKTPPPAHLRNQYRKLSQYQKWQMEKKYRKYQF